MLVNNEYYFENIKKFFLVNKKLFCFFVICTKKPAEKILRRFFQDSICLPKKPATV